MEGLKVSEVIKIKLEDLKNSKDNFYLDIRGSKQRGFFLQTPTSTAISNYLKESSKLDFSFKREYLFLGFKGINLGKILPSMTRHGVKFFINELAEDISVSLSAEKLRQFAIAYHIDQGKELSELMKHFGLSNLE